MIKTGQLKTRDLETEVKSLPRAVSLRRQDLASRLNNPHSVDRIPFTNYDYRPVMGQCCEEVRNHVLASVVKTNLFHTKLIQLLTCSRIAGNIYIRS